MVKRTLALVVSAIATSTAFVGCTDYSEFSEAELKLVEMNKEYDEAFIERFGTPDPNHDWGLTVLEPITAIGGRATRAAGFNEGSGTVLVNKNQWIERVDDATKAYHERAYRESALAHDIQIPGWPHLNGLYYGSTGGGALEGALKPSELDKKGNAWQPVGDVTEYEIQYVSTWFRTHKIDNPLDYRENLHLSDFFIQNISQDDDQKSYGDVNYDNISITDISSRTNGENISSASDAATYTNEYIWRDTNSSEKINYALDDLGFMDMDGKWTHVNNFNNNNANSNPEESLTNPQREIKYIKSSGTENFHCHPSWNTDPETQYIDSWVLVHLTWIETVKDTNSPLFGKSIPREGYYLAFDFHAGKDKTKVSQDHYYSNWIVKITPGHFNPESNKAKRVMVEDLGSSFDFDFNDIVFDVAYENYNGKNQAIITIQAAGGVMPAIIGQTPSDNSPYEVHKLLGGEEGIAYNVKPGEKTREVAIYRVDMTDTDLSKINIHVKNNINGDDTWKSYSGNGKNWMNLDNKADNPYGNPDPSGKPTNPSNGKLKAPRAFAVPLRSSIEVTYEDGEVVNPRNLETKWMQEYQCIHDTYYEFDEWVATETKSDTGFGMDKSRGWWEQTVSTEKLYNKNISSEADNPTGDGATAPATWIALHPQTDHKCFADYYLNIGGYEGPDAIWKEITKASTKQVTFTVVFESATQQNVEAILIPADVSESTSGDVTTTTMSYKGTPFATYLSSDTNAQAKSKITSVFTQWHKAVESENRYVEGKYTYVCRFTFTKAQLESSIGAHGLSSYILLYVKSDNGVTIPEHPSVENKSQWYIHY